jgi:hypothetical protein
MEELLYHYLDSVLVGMQDTENELT